MLTHLSVNNVAIAEHLELEFDQGMTVITGETGAGKSIMLDALGLALGDRADAKVVRHGTERADIHASFDIARHPEAQQWLRDHDLLDGQDCLLRRVITKEGRSRGYINGRPVPLADLRILGNKLIDIHSQHAHQSLLNRRHQQRLLDEFAGATELARQVKKISADYQRCAEQLATLQAGRDEQTARAQLLGYQVSELEELDLQPGELKALEQEQQTLANGEQIMQACQHSVALCSEGELNATSILNQAIRSLETVTVDNRHIQEARELLNGALIQAEEASRELQHHIDQFELDPERLIAVEARLSHLYDIARKHQVQPQALLELQQSLSDELATLKGCDANLEALETTLAELANDYQKTAAKLSKKRKTAAKKLQKQVEKQLQELAMNNCQLSIDLGADVEAAEDKPARFSASGLEEVQFLVSTNPGQPAQPLNKIASGGELSRISLAIQVVTAQTSTVPTLVFDEVDVGIGGATAEIVGQLLRSLGERGQVLCVTHQAQVAAKGHQHLVVSKHCQRKSVSTQLTHLDDDAKIAEIARMMGGIAVTDQSLAHAREMLAH